MAKVTVYTTPICPYCVRSKQLLSSKGIEYDEVDLSRDPALRQELMTKTRHRTVPMIFIGDEFIGGFDQLYALDRAGGLAAKVQAP